MECVLKWVRASSTRIRTRLLDRKSRNAIVPVMKGDKGTKNSSGLDGALDKMARGRVQTATRSLVRSMGPEELAPLAAANEAALAALVAHFDAEAIGDALVANEWSPADEVAILVDMARTAPIAGDRRAAIKQLRELLQEAASLAGLLRETTEQVTIGPDGSLEGHRVVVSRSVSRPIELPPATAITDDLWVQDDASSRLLKGITADVEDETAQQSSADEEPERESVAEGGTPDGGQ